MSGNRALHSRVRVPLVLGEISTAVDQRFREVSIPCTLMHLNTIRSSSGGLTWRSQPICLKDIEGEATGYSIWHLEASQEYDNFDDIKFHVYLDLWLNSDGSKREAEDGRVRKTITFDAFLLDVDGNRVETRSANRNLVEIVERKSGRIRTVEHPKKVEDSGKRVIGATDGQVKFHVELRIPLKSQQAPPRTDGGSEACNSPLVADFSGFLKDSQLSDVVLVSEDGRRFQCHRVILSARSTVFNSIFVADNNEHGQKEIKIPKISGDTLDLAIKHLYSGKWPLPLAQAGPAAEIEELIVVADMLGLDGLKSRCEAKLIQMIDATTACRMLKLADQLDCKELRRLVAGFINEHIDDVAKTTEWRHLISSAASCEPQLQQLQPRQLTEESAVKTESKGGVRMESPNPAAQSCKMV